MSKIPIYINVLLSISKIITIRRKSISRQLKIVIAHPMFWSTSTLLLTSMSSICLGNTRSMLNYTIYTLN